MGTWRAAYHLPRLSRQQMPQVDEKHPSPDASELGPSAKPHHVASSLRHEGLDRLDIGPRRHARPDRHIAAARAWGAEDLEVADDERVVDGLRRFGP